MTRSVSDDRYENRVGSGGLSLILLRSFTTKDTKDTKDTKERKERKEKTALRALRALRGELEADHQQTVVRRFSHLLGDAQRLR